MNTLEARKIYKEALNAVSSKNTAKMLTYLAEAISMDPNLKAKAINEPAFADYQKNPYFRRKVYSDDKINTGVEMMYDGAFKEAVDFFIEYKKTDPEEAQLFFYLSICFTQLERYEDALKAIDKNIEIDPKFADAYFNKATVFEKQEKYNEALEAYKKAIDLEPFYSNTYYNIGVLLLDHLNKYEEALEFFTKAIELEDPKSEFINLIRYQRALTYAELKMEKEMLEDLKKVLKRDPDAKNSIQENEIFRPYINKLGLQEILNS
ncbi:MAG: tetratricopeptide repeat protein [Daejeonella sp.]